ncbi:MAG: hypothetical protein V9G18_13345 [Albidovulum sp.]
MSDTPRLRWRRFPQKLFFRTPEQKNLENPGPHRQAKPPFPARHQNKKQRRRRGRKIRSNRRFEYSGGEKCRRWREENTSQRDRRAGNATHAIRPPTRSGENWSGWPEAIPASARGAGGQVPPDGESAGYSFRSFGSTHRRFLRYDRRQGRLLAAPRRLPRPLLGGFPLQVAQPVALVLLLPAPLLGRPPLPLGDPLGLGPPLPLLQRPVLPVAGGRLPLPLLVLGQQPHRLAARQGVHLARRVTVQIEAPPVAAVDERQQIAGSPDVVGQHPAQEIRVHRLAQGDQPLADVRVDVELEREEIVVVLGERLGEAFHQKAMQGGGCFFGEGHGSGEVGVDGERSRRDR